MAELYDILAIQALLPHRYPFLMVDRIMELEPGKRIVGLKNVSINEPYFQGHFPHRPIMPGVLIIEAMAQIGAILAYKSDPSVQQKLVYLTGIERAKFRRPVVPGDQLRVELEVRRARPPFWKMRGRAEVDGQIVCEAELTAMVVEKETLYGDPSDSPGGS